MTLTPTSKRGLCPILGVSPTPFDSRFTGLLSGYAGNPPPPPVKIGVHYRQTVPTRSHMLCVLPGWNPALNYNLVDVQSVILKAQSNPYVYPSSAQQTLDFKDDCTFTVQLTPLGFAQFDLVLFFFLFTTTSTGTEHAVTFVHLQKGVRAFEPNFSDLDRRKLAAGDVRQLSLAKTDDSPPDVFTFEVQVANLVAGTYIIEILPDTLNAALPNYILLSSQTISITVDYDFQQKSATCLATTIAGNLPASQTEITFTAIIQNSAYVSGDVHVLYPQHA